MKFQDKVAIVAGGTKALAKREALLEKFMISWLIPRFNNFNMVLENMTPNIEKGEYILKLFSNDLFESFKWDIYDYPCATTYWKHQSEYEIHLIRKTTGKAFIGDYIGEFGPGCLMAVGSN